MVSASFSGVLFTIVGGVLSYLLPSYGWFVLLMLLVGCLADGFRHISLKFTLIARGFLGQRKQGKEHKAEQACLF